MKLSFSPRLAALLCLSTLVGCASIAIDLPAVSESAGGDRLPGKVVWRDLLSNDVVASRKFYGTLFGWEFEEIGTASGFREDSAYTLIRHEGQLIGGMIDTLALNGRDDISQWVVAMSVEDVDRAAATAKANGGQVITPPTDLRRRGKIAVIQDAEGALIALLQTSDGDPADQEPVVDGFLWDELWTSDVDSATAFYSGLAGLQLQDRRISSDTGATVEYRLLQSGGKPRVGIMPHPLEDLGPVWVSYLRVTSPADIAAKVAGLGGRVIVEAQQRSVGGEVAFVAGPSGAGIALQTWPLDKD